MPYRDLPCDDDSIDHELRRDDCVLAWLLIAVGGIRVAIAVALAETFGSEATLGGVFLAIGVVLLASRRCPS